MILPHNEHLLKSTRVAIILKSAAGDVIRAMQPTIPRELVDWAAHGCTEVKHPAFTHWKQERLKWERNCPRCGKDKRPTALKCERCGMEFELLKILKRRGLLEKR